MLQTPAWVSKARTPWIVLSAMASFRARAHEARENARREIDDLYRKYGREYGWFDPLDVYLPPMTGLSHADGTRVATMSGGARSEVDALRTRVNEAVLKRLDAVQFDALVVAKRRRRTAFDTAIGDARRVKTASQTRAVR